VHRRELRCKIVAVLDRSHDRPERLKVGRHEMRRDQDQAGFRKDRGLEYRRNHDGSLCRSPGRGRAAVAWGDLDSAATGRTLIFTGPKGASLNKNAHNERIWKPALRALGIEPSRDTGMHQLRHHYASVLLDARCPSRRWRATSVTPTRPSRCGCTRT